MRACAFTGHRQIKESHRATIANVIKRAIEYAYREGCRIFYTGGAIGFDTLAAREVVRFRMSHRDISLVMLLPCIDQGKKWTGAERDSYEYLLRESDEIKYVSEEYTDTCMKERNLALASSADVLIAYVCRNYSGSAQTVRMASKMGKQIYNLYPSLENG